MSAQAISVAGDGNTPYELSIPGQLALVGFFCSSCGLSRVLPRQLLRQPPLCNHLVGQCTRARGTSSTGRRAHLEEGSRCAGQHRTGGVSQASRWQSGWGDYRGGSSNRRGKGRGW